MIPMPNPLFLDVSVLLIGLFLLVIEAFDEKKESPFVGWLAVWGIGLVFVLSFFTAPKGYTLAPQLAPFYTGDSYAIFYKRLALGTTLLVLIMSLEFRSVLARFIPGVGKHAGQGEFFALPVFTCLGLMWMASAIDFMMIFVSLELVTISFYILVSYMRRSAASLEAGVKYLILGALSTGFLVYGITWIFGVTGQTNLDKVSAALSALPAGSHTAALFGVALILVGLGFKIAAAPFQLWVPDVYQGAPTPVTAFLSVGSKAAGFVVLLRVLYAFLGVPFIADKVALILGGMALLTLIYGNLAAMPQTNLKRLLAYSSIGHAGYLLVSLASLGSAIAPITVSFYLAGYLLMTLLAFLVLCVVNAQAGGDDIAHFNGLGQRSPLLAFGLLVAMLSLAGVPFTAGFLGKFMVFRDAIAQGKWSLVIVGVVAVAAGFYYYLKVIRAMYWNVPAEGAEAIAVSRLTRLTIVVLIGLIVLFGVYPTPILAALQ
jgi:NADH-quinone oxidoreductase subunit N